MTDENVLMHIGTPRHSGRYPWGSGENPNQRNKNFLSYVKELEKQGMSQAQIAKGMGMSTTKLRAEISIAGSQVRNEKAAQALKLKEKGYSNVAIGAQLGLNESSVRALLDPSAKERRDIIQSTASMLKDEVKKKKYLDVGEGTENYIGVSKTRLNTALEVLKEEGYRVDRLKIAQVGTGKYTEFKVLSAPGTVYKDIIRNKDQIKAITEHSVDGGRTFLGIRTPTNVSSKKIQIAYDEDGGTAKDGIIELRRGVKDLDLGNSRYAQVRIAVDGTHYLKGMAVYADDLPDGVNIRFNTNKAKGTPKLDVMKPMKKGVDGLIDSDNPFGAVIKAGGQRGALNIVNEEGDWYKWSGKLSSQMLSKQPPSLIKKQLGITYDIKKTEFDNIMSLTNPSVRKMLLEKFADDADASSVSLKAIGLPRTKSHVIIPFPKMSETEVYAPQFNNGEKVVLIRHPHGGRFEIPELTVNNRNATAQKIIGRAADAIGISPKVAERLSGADFDGDTVLVIPNKTGAVKTHPALKELQDFDPRSRYKEYPGMKVMSNTQTQMGVISNLITDMTIRGANFQEIAKAVKHSMVVIDAEKHRLDYKQSFIDNDIANLKKKYQGMSGKGQGATTLISRAKSKEYVLDRKPRPAALGGPIDPKTGEKVYVPTGESYTNKAGELVVKKIKSTKMAETKDAYKLSSGTVIEEVYADHANRLKGLANEARKSSYTTKAIKYSPSAKETYKAEVDSLNAKLNIANKNKPLERQAQLLAGSIVSAKKQANPSMDADALKKIKGQALMEARVRTGAKKSDINFSDREWEAIQSGAISASKLDEILKKADIDRVKELSMPRENKVMSSSKIARANNMLAAGYTQAEVAAALGVPTSTLNSSIAIQEG